jgi:hypothetical protein
MTFRIWNVRVTGPMHGWLKRVCGGQCHDCHVMRVDVSPPCCRAVVEEQHRMQGLGYFWG